MIDTRGYICPTPVLMVQKEVKKNEPSVLTVLADDQCAVENITRFAQNHGYRVKCENKGDDFELTLEK